MRPFPQHLHLAFLSALLLCATWGGAIGCHGPWSPPRPPDGYVPPPRLRYGMTFDQVQNKRSLTAAIEYHTLPDGTRLEAHQIRSSAPSSITNNSRDSGYGWLYFCNGILVKERGNSQWPTREELDYAALIANTGAEPSLK